MNDLSSGQAYLAVASAPLAHNWFTIFKMRRLNSRFYFHVKLFMSSKLNEMDIIKIQLIHPMNGKSIF